MAFTGKSTYSAGATLPEIVEDVSDLISIVSPYETPLLDCLGDPLRSAQSTYHEWLEDSLIPNRDQIDYDMFSNGMTDTSFCVSNADRFRIGDQIQTEGSSEIMLVTNIAGSEITVERGYGGTTAEELADQQLISILGNAAIEGAEKPNARFTNRTRKGNYTQIFTATVEVSGSDLAARQLGIADEMDYQKQERLRELIRDLENTIINGTGPVANAQGSSTVRRTLKGILASLSTNVFQPGLAGMPAGTTLDEDKLNYALRQIWENSCGSVDTIVVGGYQKRQINQFLAASRQYGSGDESFKDMVSVYESDFGVCRIVTSRWVPADAAILLDSSRISVMPLSGRSFHFKPLASTGDYESGELIGEYTLEFKNEQAHGVIRGLTHS